MIRKNKIIPEFDHERFLSRISIDQNTECWNWIGGKMPTGYGYMVIKNSNYRAHRISYGLFVSSLSDTLVIDHICRNKSCCNPDHLREVTQTVNALENSESIMVKHKNKTHCYKGHELKEDAIYRTKTHRYCRECLRGNMKKFKAKLIKKNQEEGRIANKNKTHCKHGHEFTPDNINWFMGKRRCRECNRNTKLKQQLNKQESGE